MGVWGREGIERTVTIHEGGGSTGSSFRDTVYQEQSERVVYNLLFCKSTELLYEAIKRAHKSQQPALPYRGSAQPSLPTKYSYIGSLNFALPAKAGYRQLAFLKGSQ